MKIVVFDLETKVAPSKHGPVTWDDYDKMGIAVGAAFDFSTGESHVYFDDNLMDLINLLRSADLITGFNIQHFDLRLLYFTMLSQMPPGELIYISPEKMPPVYDIYLESKKGAGADTYDPGYKLDDHLLHTLGKDWLKTGQGAHAPQLWQDKKFGKLADYCLQDVDRERRLFEYVWKHGEISRQAQTLHQVAWPQDLLKVSHKASPYDLINYWRVDVCPKAPEATEKMPEKILALGDVSPKIDPVTLDGGLLMTGAEL